MWDVRNAARDARLCRVERRMIAGERGQRPRSNMGDRILKILTLSTAWGFVILVLSLGGMLLWRAFPAFQAMGLSFFTTSTWDPVAPQFGTLAFVYGTVCSSFIALLIGAPVGDRK